MLRFLNYINMIRNKSDLKLCHSLIIGVLIYLILFFTVWQVINSWNSWNLSREVIRDRKCVYYRILLETCCKYISVGQDRMNVLAADFHVPCPCRSLAGSSRHSSAFEHASHSAGRGKGHAPQCLRAVVPGQAECKSVWVTLQEPDEASAEPELIGTLGYWQVWGRGVLRMGVFIAADF